jgi:hypothetical protein
MSTNSSNTDGRHVIGDQPWFVRAAAAAAALVLGATLVAWTMTGAHRGWTRTEVTEMKRDEVTGLDYPETRRGFVAGLDFLAAGSGLAVALGGTAWLVRRRKPATALPRPARPGGRDAT